VRINPSTFVEGIALRVRFHTVESHDLVVVGAITTAPAVSMSDCTCLPGYTSPDDGRCAPCANSYHKNWTGTGACTPCPAEAVTAADASNALSSCFCLTGYSGDAASGEDCRACPAGSYKDFAGRGDCLPCDAGTYSNWTGAGVCALCPGGTYASAPGTVNCTRCHQHSFSPDGSDNITHCDCLAGYYKGADSCSGEISGMVQRVCVPVCAACPMGTYKNLPGSGDVSECLLCGAGTYKEIEGPGVCLECSAGTYSSALGAAENPCLTCPPGTYSSAGSESCAACPANSISAPGSVTVTACTCAMGHTGADGAPCTTCQPGTYKNGTGPGECLPCELGTSSIVGAGSCTPCPEGTYASNPGTANCTRCPEDWFSPEGSDNINDCGCTAGYYQGADSCSGEIAGMIQEQWIFRYYWDDWGAIAGLGDYWTYAREVRFWTVSLTASVETIDYADAGYSGVEGFRAVHGSSFPYEYFIGDFSGNLHVVQAGTYTFATTSDDGSHLWINGGRIVDNGGLHGSTTVRGSVYLGAGKPKR